MSDALRPPLFTFNDAWSGGDYELALAIGPRSDERLLDAISALWSHPDLEGCYLDRDSEPETQRRLGPFWHGDEENVRSLYGIAYLQNDVRIACDSYVLPNMEEIDWLVLGLPIVSLAQFYPCSGFGFPYGPAADDWPGLGRYQVEDWLARIGLWVAESVTIQFGLIGYMVSIEAGNGTTQTARPEERKIGYLWPVDGVMTYHRRTY